MKNILKPLKKTISLLNSEVSTAFQYLQFVRFTSTILVGILLVKLGAQKDQVSTFEFFLFVVNLFSFFWVNGFNTSILSFLPTLSKRKHKIFISTYGWLIVAISILASILALICIQFNLVKLNINTSLFLFYFLLTTPASLIENLLIARNKIKMILIYSNCIYLFYFLFPVVGYLLTESITGIITGLLIWGIIRFTFFIIIFFKQSVKFNRKLAIQFLTFSAPLIAYVLIGASVNYIDGILVNHYFPSSQFAVYKYGARELPLYDILITSYVIAMVPKASSNLEKSLQQIRKHLSKLMDFLFPLAALLLLISPFLFQIAYSKEYLFSAQIFNLYLLLLINRFLSPDIILLAKKQNSVLLLITIVETVINVLLSLLFIQYWGLLGIVYATLIAYTVERIIIIYYCKKTYGIRLNDLINAKKYFIYSLFLIGVFVLSTLFKLYNGNIFL